jgi:DNA repair protein RadC
MLYTEVEQSVIDQAFRIIESKLVIGGEEFTNSELVKDYCKLRLANLEHEVFVMLLLDNQHRLIKYIELFRGTIDGAAVYPREVVKIALLHNAAATVLCHNHPSTLSDPSQADIAITQRLKTALNTVDIRVLDHVIVGGLTITSFAERGLL